MRIYANLSHFYPVALRVWEIDSFDYVFFPTGLDVPYKPKFFSCCRPLEIKLFFLMHLKNRTVLCSFLQISVLSNHNHFAFICKKYVFNQEYIAYFSST